MLTSAASIVLPCVTGEEQAAGEYEPCILPIVFESLLYTSLSEERGNPSSSGDPQVK